MSVAAAQQSTAPDSRELYNKNCRQCHGTKGTPPKTMKAKFEHIADLSDTAHMAKISDDSLLVVIQKGIKDEKDMKGFADKLSPEEIKAIVAYVRSLSAKPQ